MFKWYLLLLTSIFIQCQMRSTTFKVVICLLDFGTSQTPRNNQYWILLQSVITMWRETKQQVTLIVNSEWTFSHLPDLEKIPGILRAFLCLEHILINYGDFFPDRGSVKAPCVPRSGEHFIKRFVSDFHWLTDKSYWNPWIWLAESELVSENHWQNAWWNAPLTPPRLSTKP